MFENQDAKVELSEEDRLALEQEHELIQKEWDEAFENLGEDKSQILDVTSIHQDSESLKKYLSENEGNISGRGKKFLKASIALRENQEKLY